MPTGTLRTPAGFQPLQFGASWVLGRYRAEIDVESVRLYEVSAGLEASDELANMLAVLYHRRVGVDAVARGTWTSD